MFGEIAGIGSRQSKIKLGQKLLPFSFGVKSFRSGNFAKHCCQQKNMIKFKKDWEG
jgi:hypothetical protein